MSEPIDDEALRQEIARRAYQRFCDRGCVAGGDLDDWLAAEREVLESQKGETVPDGPGRVKPRGNRKARQ